MTWLSVSNVLRIFSEIHADCAIVTNRPRIVDLNFNVKINNARHREIKLAQHDIAHVFCYYT